MDAFVIGGDFYKCVCVRTGVCVCIHVCMLLVVVLLVFCFFPLKVSRPTKLINSLKMNVMHFYLKFQQQPNTSL